MDGVSAFRIYIACKAYFEQKFNRDAKFNLNYYLKTGMNSYDSKRFYKRNDVLLFESLGKRYDYKHVVLFFLANFIYGNDRAIYENYDNAVKLMNRYLGNREKMTYIVQTDLNSAKNRICKDYLSGSYLLNHNNDSLTKEIKDGTIWIYDPICIFNLYKADVISMETMVAIDKVTRIVNVFRDEYKEMSTVCGNDFRVIRKSNPFFKLNDYTKDYIKNFFNI